MIYRNTALTGIVYLGHLIIDKVSTSYHRKKYDFATCEKWGVCTTPINPYPTVKWINPSHIKPEKLAFCAIQR